MTQQTRLIPGEDNDWMLGACGHVWNADLDLETCPRCPSDSVEPVQGTHTPETPAKAVRADAKVLLKGIPADGVEEIFFYTTHTPHKWSSGPVRHTTRNRPDYGPIQSLEEAKALAESKAVDSWGEDRVVATYGVAYEYKVPERK